MGGSNPNYPSTASTYIAQEAFTPPTGGTAYNNYHLAFTARNSHWIFDQMQNTADNLNCSSACSPDYVISGTTPMCGNTGVFSISGLANGSTVTWSVLPSGYATLSPTTGSSTTLTKQANGNVTLTATISPCGQTVTKLISIGAPSINATGSPYGACNGSTQTWSLTASPASGSNWNWYVSYLGTNASIYIRNGSSPTAFADVIGGGTVSLNYTDVCGVARNAGGPTVYSTCHAKHIYQISPNPARDVITILTSTNNKEEGASPNLIYAIKITDRFGIIRKTISCKEGVSTKKVSVADLTTGTYLVSLFDGTDWNSQPLLINK